MPEGLKGADCKSAGYAYVGSNPTRPTTISTPIGPHGSVVEHSLGKGEVTSSNLVEGLTYNPFLERVLLYLGIPYLDLDSIPVFVLGQCFFQIIDDRSCHINLSGQLNPF